MAARKATDPPKHITPDQAKRLFDAAREIGRNPARDRALIMAIFYHGLRVAEVTHWQWPDVDLRKAVVYVRRAHNGNSANHPIPPDELRALRTLRNETNAQSDECVFLSERGAPLSADMVARIIQRASVVAGLGFHTHPHMLRHGCGFALANKGFDIRVIQEYLGHSRISSTTRYTDGQRLPSTRLRNLFN